MCWSSWKRLAKTVAGHPSRFSENDSNLARIVFPDSREMNRLLTSLGLTLVLLSPGHAHHGFANHFDPTREETIEGAVTRFDFVNPHTKFYLRVARASGETEDWVVETSGASEFLRNGQLSGDTIQPGDRLWIVGHPARAKSYEMRANRLRLPNGDELQLSNPYMPPSFLSEVEQPEQQ